MERRGHVPRSAGATCRRCSLYQDAAQTVFGAAIEEFTRDLQAVARRLG